MTWTKPKTAAAPFVVTLVVLSAGLLPQAAIGHTLVGEAFEAHGPPQLLVPGSVILRLQGEVAPPYLTPGQRDARIKDLEGRASVKLDFMARGPLGYSLYRVRDAARPEVRQVPTEAETRALVQRLNDDPGVDDASVNGWNRISAVPNDEYYSLMWHLDDIGAPSAWNITTGSGSQRVGVIDTGIRRSHQDLSAKDIAGWDWISDAFTANDGNGMDAEYNDPGDGGDCGGQFFPDSFHGTHVSGTILASSNNSVGVAGVNWAAGLITARALGRCGGANFDIMAAAAWMAGYDWTQDDQNPLPVQALAPQDVAQVVNMSLGRQDVCTQFEQTVINFMNQQGTLAVIAAGNENTIVASPANCDGAIAVGAYARNNQRASYSNIGPEVVVFGPGGDGNQEDWVLSTFGDANDAYQYSAGTSMASPHVAGAVSLLLDLNPTLNRNQVVALFNQGQTCTGCQNIPTLVLDDMLVEVGGPEPDDTFEDNDNLNTATPVSCGGEIDLIGNDNDFLVVSVPAGDTLDVTLVPGGSTLDLDLELLSGNGAQLKASELPAGQSESITHTSTGVSLYLRVFPFDPNNVGDNHGPYHVSVGCAPATTPEPDPQPDPSPDVGVEPDPSPDVGVEPDPSPDPGPGVLPGDVVVFDNPTLGTAAPLVCDEEVRVYVADVDWFLVEVDDWDTLEVTTTGTPSRAPVEIKSRGGHTLLAQSQGNALYQTAAQAALGAGQYAVRVTAPDGPTTVELQVACLAGEEQGQSGGGCRHVVTEAGGAGPAGWLLLLVPVVLRRRAQKSSKVRTL